MITEGLQTFIWILKFPLPALEQTADDLTKQLFVLLKDYAKAGAGRGENYELVQNCFKVCGPAGAPNIMLLSTNGNFTKDGYKRSVL